MTYVYIYLLDNYGMRTTLQFAGAVSFTICLSAAVTYLPTNYSTEDVKCVGEKSIFQRYISVFRNKKYLIFLLVIIVDYFAFAVSGFHQVQLGLEMGLPASICNQLPIFTSISSGVGRIVCGFILDFFFTDKLIYYQCSLLVVSLIALLGLFIKTASPLIAFIWILGFFDGNLQASVPIALKFLIGTSTLAEGISIIFVASAIPMMLGPPIVGMIVDKTNSYSAFFYIAGLPHFVACCIAQGIRFVKEENTDDNEDESKMLNDELVVISNKLEAKELLRMETPV